MEQTRLYYSDYLQLNKILSAQQLRSSAAGTPAHEEMLFIIVHQAFELWFKQLLWELRDVITRIGQDYVPESDVGIALDRVRRMLVIMDLLERQFDVLETMTPSQFMEFRDQLYPASGFESVQFRMVEVALGVDERTRVQIDAAGYRARLRQEDRAALEDVARQPSLFTAIERWLEKMPFMESGGYRFLDAYRQAVERIFAHDREELAKVTTLSPDERIRQEEQIARLEAHFAALFDEQAYRTLQERGEKRLSQRATLAALFITVYANYPLLQQPYRLLDAVLELDKRVSMFRFRHAMMVSRMIGQRTGTGGSSGFDYLMATVLRHRVFADLAALSSYILPSSHVPPLPDDIAHKLHFVAEIS
ncbi:MAG: tryptophan 2,3-dioxygenase family protein [Bacteroidota bacterium]|nr:tryptophan 2,3-dioxygenase [Candidatus Kapabacteria bacterium]MCX7937502.1 tryptophan 2,3-dioxygenase [Chlorobiota bacterium]MDW8271697.1 tryptophan 2,3-dioxygenase family protein [Bacteroidota bacterium]